MKNKNLDKTITRSVLTAKEAAFKLRVSENDFTRRFVATEKIIPIIYDDNSRTPLYAVEDVENLAKSSKRRLKPSTLERIKKGISITKALEMETAHD